MNTSSVNASVSVYHDVYGGKAYFYSGEHWYELDGNRYLIPKYIRDRTWVDNMSKKSHDYYDALCKAMYLHVTTGEAYQIEVGQDDPNAWIPAAMRAGT